MLNTRKGNFQTVVVLSILHSRGFDLFATLYYFWQCLKYLLTPTAFLEELLHKKLFSNPCFCISFFAWFLTDLHLQFSNYFPKLPRWFWMLSLSFSVLKVPSRSVSSWCAHSLFCHPCCWFIQWAEPGPEQTLMELFSIHPLFWQ